MENINKVKGLRKIWSWIKEHPVKFFMIYLVISLIIIPLLINILYQFHSIGLFSTSWDSGDVLSFYGSISSAIGTILLGLSTIIINEGYKKENDKRMKEVDERKEIEQQRYIQTLQPQLVIKLYYNRINIFNYSDNIAKYIKVSVFKDSYEVDIRMSESNLVPVSCFNSLGTNQSVSSIYSIGSDLLKSNTFDLTIRYQDCLGNNVEIKYRIDKDNKDIPVKQIYKTIS